MSIIATDQWLKQYQASKSGVWEVDMKLQQKILCEQLTSFFPDATLHDIHQHLIQNGLFLPSPSDQKMIAQLCKGKYWRIAADTLVRLKQGWNGPAVPVFIFPANMENEQLRVDFQGRSGLAYHDKIFLFISNHTSKAALQTLITHEYNHVCRLNFLNKEEQDITLLDAMVMEGLAETAVAERLGKEYLAPWTSMYSLQYAQTCWKKWILPHLNIKKLHYRHQLLMYGDQSIPKWLGYGIGFHLVQSFFENNGSDMHQSLKLPTKEIRAGSVFS